MRRILIALVLIALPIVGTVNLRADDRAGQAPIRVAQASGFWDQIRSMVANMPASFEAAEEALAREGGSRIVLQVDTETQREETLEILRDDVRRLLREARIAYTELGVRNDGVEVRIRQEAQVAQALKALEDVALAGSQAPERSVEVTDLGGRLIRIAPSAAGAADQARRAVNRTIEVLQRRHTDAGIKNAGLRQEGNDRILVLLPGVRDPERVVRLQVTMAKLELRLIDMTADLNEALSGRPPPGSEVLYGLADKQPHVVRKAVLISGDDIADADAGMDERTREPVVSFRFNAAGARKFARVTQENVGQALAIVLDQAVISAPVIREPILGGSGQISGNFTPEQANDLATMLRAGALPAPLAAIEQRVVEPTAPSKN